MAWSKVSRHARGYGTAWTKLRQSVMAAEPLCRECKVKGKVTAATELDHIVPKAKGGTDDRSNVQPLCAEHHRAKSLRESAEAQGRTYRDRPRIGADGWPVQE